MAIKVRAITATGTFTIPADFPAGNTLQVECVGAGGQGARGGGAYAKTNALTGITASQTVYVQVGATGSDTWFNKAANSAPANTTNGALAKCGGDSSSTAAGSGGQASASIGDLKYSGGDGGINYINEPDSADVIGAGGGAAGPSGAGKNAGNGRKATSPTTVWWTSSTPPTSSARASTTRGTTTPPLARLAAWPLFLSPRLLHWWRPWALCAASGCGGGPDDGRATGCLWCASLTRHASTGSSLSRS